VVEIETHGIPDALVAGLQDVPGVRAVGSEIRGQLQVLVLQCDSGADPTHAVLARLGDTGVGRISAREPTLEDAYVELVTG
jgi:ABC-2 type transport system ATP-binding protein